MFYEVKKMYKINLILFEVYKYSYSANCTIICFLLILTANVVKSFSTELNLKIMTNNYTLKSECYNQNVAMIVDDMSIVYPSRCEITPQFINWSDSKQKQLLVTVRNSCNGQQTCLLYKETLTGITTNCNGNNDKPEKYEIMYFCYPTDSDKNTVFDMAENLKTEEDFSSSEVYLVRRSYKKMFTSSCFMKADNMNVVAKVLSGDPSVQIWCQDKLQTINDTKQFSNIECYNAKQMRFTVTAETVTITKLEVLQSGKMTISCGNVETDTTSTGGSKTEATTTVTTTKQTATTSTTMKQTVTTTSTAESEETNNASTTTQTTEIGSTSVSNLDTTNSRFNKISNDAEMHDKNSKTALICAVSAGAVFVIIIIILSVMCIRKRKRGYSERLRTMPAIVPPKAHYKSEDEYAIIDATNSYENANASEYNFRPTTTVSLRDHTNADEDSDAFDDYSTIPKTDEQYTEISSIPSAFAGTAEPEGKTKSMRKGSNSVSCSQQPILQQTAFVACEGTDQMYTKMADAPSAVYSTPNKLKKKSIRTSNPAANPPPAADPASAVDPAVDPAPESNDVYSHLSHFIQKKTETENVYNG